MIRKLPLTSIFVSICMVAVDPSCHACPAKSVLKEDRKDLKAYKVAPSNVPSLRSTAYAGVSAPGRENRGFGYYLEPTGHFIALNRFIEAAEVSQSKDQYILHLVLAQKYKKAVQTFVSNAPPDVVAFQLSLDGRVQDRYGDPGARDLKTLHLVISESQFRNLCVNPSRRKPENRRR